MEAESKNRSREIFIHWKGLNDILTQHEEILRKRWIKKSKEQRKNLLLAAWPNMSSTHRPEFQAQRRETTKQRRIATRFHDAYLLPYIKLEDLCKAKNLLLLFQSRGHHRPDVFAYRDSIMQVAINVRAVTVVHLNGFSMDLSGQTAETYSRLLSHGKGESSMPKMIAGLDFHPGCGLLVLELQEKLLSFLHRCAELILHDLIPTSTTATGSSISTPPPPLVTRVPTDIGWESVATMAAQAPYRVPIQFDFARLESLIKAKRDEAEDHIWLLREDPGYSRNFVGELSEHSVERLPLKSERVELGEGFWGKVFGPDMLAGAYSNLWLWDLARSYIRQLAHYRKYYGERISLGDNFRQSTKRCSFISQTSWSKCGISL